MHPHDELEPADRELELQLSSLAPAPHRIERDTLMFRAGHASARKQIQVWRLGAVTLFVVVAGLAVPMRQPAGPATASAGNQDPAISAPSPVTPTQVVSAQDSIPAPVPTTWPRLDYVRLRDRVTWEGLDALPTVEWAAWSDEAVESAGGGRGFSGPFAPEARTPRPSKTIKNGDRS